MAHASKTFKHRYTSFKSIFLKLWRVCTLLMKRYKIFWVISPENFITRLKSIPGGILSPLSFPPWYSTAPRVRYIPLKLHTIYCHPLKVDHFEGRCGMYKNSICERVRYSHDNLMQVCSGGNILKRLKLREEKSDLYMVRDLESDCEFTFHMPNFN